MAARSAGTDVRPVIGICSRPDESDEHAVVSNDYSDCIAQAGGIPVALPIGNAATGMAWELAERLDGLVLTGGGDVCPQSFGGHAYAEGTCAPLEGLLPCRDEFECAMAIYAWQNDLPTLGICRGAQVMNVSRGGTLVRDVTEQGHPATLAHYMREPYDRPQHTIELVRGSGLANLLGVTELEVNSIHHQAISTPAPDGRIVAYALDGTPEAIEFDGRSFFVGVQWHPEILRSTPQVFDALVGAARRHMSWGKPAEGQLANAS
ncbi:MAG: gamma-glutamyl-gamma-aminobutyrate hydrolase family protein [Atopobiaceae bacterium]|jgi:putative glutamine amidotransferase|nr:gamma-glutamyl-gamma-aminobutyrate hydrolase family protein [Atopobiaceae bacterium]